MPGEYGKVGPEAARERCDFPLASLQRGVPIDDLFFFPKTAKIQPLLGENSAASCAV